MKLARRPVGAVILLSLACGIVVAQEPFADVNMILGTANDGQTTPNVGMPFAMTDWVPETRPNQTKCITAYYYKDTKITGFRGSHFISGGCGLEYGSVTLMPVTGPIDISPEGRASAFRHETEKMNPAYYSVMLDRYGERVEMTGATRSGMLRITAPDGQAPSVVIQPYAKPGEGFIEVHAAKQEIVGFNPVRRYYQGSGQLAGFSGYFVVRFKLPFQAHGTWCGKDLHEGVDTQGNGCAALGAYATFAPASGPILVKIGTSFTSLEEAAKNLDAEEPGWDFNAVEQKTEAVWRERLHRIEIEGASAEQRKVFYSAFYHASLVPRIASDVDGTYNGFAQEGKLHQFPNGAYYDDFSMWDIFRALHPLLTIIDPDREQDMVQSMVLKGEQGGFLPIFPMWNSFTSEMVGDHTVAVVTDAYMKGLRRFDVPEAYRLIMQNATVTPPRDQYVLGKGRRALDSYLKYGYIPLEDQVLDAFHQREQVSRTLEYAYDDFVVGEMAQALGHSDDAAIFGDMAGDLGRRDPVGAEDLAVEEDTGAAFRDALDGFAP